jgi:hypothetical protein
MTVNWRRGLFRGWVLFTVIWIGTLSILGSFMMEKELGIVFSDPNPRWRPGTRIVQLPNSILAICPVILPSIDAWDISFNKATALASAKFGLENPLPPRGSWETNGLAYTYVDALNAQKCFPDKRGLDVEEFADYVDSKYRSTVTKPGWKNAPIVQKTELRKDAVQALLLWLFAGVLGPPFAVLGLGIAGLWVAHGFRYEPD